MEQTNQPWGQGKSAMLITAVNLVEFVVHVCLVIVKAQLPGIYGSKPIEFKGVARGRGWFMSLATGL